MVHELYLNHNNDNNHLSWSCQILMKLHYTCNGPHCPPRSGPKRPVLSPTRPLKGSPTLAAPGFPRISPQPGLCPGLQTSRTIFYLQSNSLQMGSQWGFFGFCFLTELVTNRRFHINIRILATTDSAGCLSKSHAPLPP